MKLPKVITIAATTALASAGLAFGAPGVADAAGDGTCGNPSTNWAQEFCISRYANYNGSTDNYMNQGWTSSSFSSTNTYLLGNQSFHNGGGTVASQVNSARNKDNVNRKNMCFYGDFVTYPIASVSYSWNGWKNTSGQAQNITVMKTKSTSSNC